VVEHVFRGELVLVLELVVILDDGDLLLGLLRGAVEAASYRLVFGLGVFVFVFVLVGLIHGLVLVLVLVGLGVFVFVFVFVVSRARGFVVVLVGLILVLLVILGFCVGAAEGAVAAAL